MTKYVNDVPFTISSPTSNSSEAFLYFSSTPSVGSVSSSTITLNALGTSTITAVQPSGGGFNSGITSTTLTVIDLLPAISYNTPNTLTKGTLMTSLTPTSSGGVVASYSILPSLPPGLTFSTTTGVFSGTPLVPFVLTTYTVTATNTTGSATANVVIGINDLVPDSFTYTTPNTFTVGTPIAALTPIFATSSGGDIVTFSIAPTLPAGLILNASTGKISGVPSAASTITSYVVTGTNSGGSKTATLSITINDLSPSNLEYSTPNVLYNGVTITPLLPSFSGGAISSYVISSNLPSGLSFDTSSGIISGTPAAVTAQATYRITGSNSSGNTVFKDISLLVSENAPTNLVYNTPNVWVIGSPITNLTPTSAGGVPTSYSVLPSLPSGLTLNALNGVISGTPTALAANTTYLITAENFIGKTTTNVEIHIIDIAMSNLVYFTPVYYMMHEVVIPNTPTISGGTVVSYSVTPPLPTGLTLDTTTGAISGTPTVRFSAANYTVTALNSVGTTRSCTVRIGVNQFCGSWD